MTVPLDLAPAIRSGRPLVSVVVPCYGEGRYLGDCLRSLREQTYADIEIVIVDDAGTDDSFGMALEFSRLDDRSTVLRSETNVGLGAIRNTMTERVRGDLMLYLDGDDFVPEFAIAARVKALAEACRRQPGVVANHIAGAYGDWEHVAESATFPYDGRPSRRLGTIDLEASRGGNVFIVSAPLVRRDVMLDSGGFAERVVGGEDHLGWLRVLGRGYVFAPCRHTVAFYRQKASSMLRSSSLALAATAYAARSWVEELETPHETPPQLVDRGLEQHRAGERTMRWGRARPTPTVLSATLPDDIPMPEISNIRNPDPLMPEPIVRLAGRARAFLDLGNEKQSRSPLYSAGSRRERAAPEDLLLVGSGSEVSVAAAYAGAILIDQGYSVAAAVSDRRAYGHAIVGLEISRRAPLVDAHIESPPGQLRVSAGKRSTDIELEHLAGIAREALHLGGDVPERLVVADARPEDGQTAQVVAPSAHVARTWADAGKAIPVAALADLTFARSVEGGRTHDPLVETLRGARSGAGTPAVAARLRTTAATLLSGGDTNGRLSRQ